MDISKVYEAQFDQVQNLPGMTMTIAIDSQRNIINEYLSQRKECKSIWVMNIFEMLEFRFDSRCEFDSNATAQRRKHFWKQKLPRIVIKNEMQIKLREGLSANIRGVITSERRNPGWDDTTAWDWWYRDDEDEKIATISGINKRMRFCTNANTSGPQ
jgi:hypothetical protein